MRKIIALLATTFSTNLYASCYMGELDSSIMSVTYSDLSKYQSTDKREVQISIPTFHDLAGGGKNSGKVTGIYLSRKDPYLSIPLSLTEENGQTKAFFYFQESDKFKDLEIVASIDYMWDQPRPARCTAHNVVAALKYNQAHKAQPSAAGTPQSGAP